MPIETITFKNKEYPKFQSVGGASLWVREFAKQYCIGRGYDIGFSKTKWQYPNSIGIDAEHTQPFNAMNLPYDKMDYIHSSHCLEHVNENWHNVLDYWLTKIKIGGIIFLYLPHKSQEYWLPENNRKHIHSFTGKEIADYLRSLGHKVMRSGVDLNNSFVVVCEKIESAVKVVGKIKLEQIGTEPQYNKLYGMPDSNGDVVMPGAFDKSIAGVFNESNAILKNHTNNWPNDNITDFTNKIKDDRLKTEAPTCAPLTKEQTIVSYLNAYQDGKITLPAILSDIYDCRKGIL